MQVEVPDRQPRPFLKWAGGKTQLLPELLRRVPAGFNRYFEPFVGAGALFWALPNRDEHQCFLGDTNLELVKTYQAIQVVPDQVIEFLQRLATEHSEERYYEVRALSALPSRTHVAARMIYLNKTGFNGLYRVNRAGGFNVPWGKRVTFVPDVDNLMACGFALQGVSVDWGGYQETCAGAQPGDFVYLDPPYMPVKDDSFTAYTQAGFSYQDHVDLAAAARGMRDAGVHVLASNSIAARKLYEDHGFKVEVVQARRNINSKGGGRGAVEEIMAS